MHTYLCQIFKGLPGGALSTFGQLFLVHHSQHAVYCITFNGYMVKTPQYRSPFPISTFPFIFCLSGTSTALLKICNKNLLFHFV